MQSVIATSGFVLINYRVVNINGLHEAIYGDEYGAYNSCYLHMKCNEHPYIIHLWVADVSSLVCAVDGL